MKRGAKFAYHKGVVIEIIQILHDMNKRERLSISFPLKIPVTHLQITVELHSLGFFLSAPYFREDTHQTAYTISPLLSRSSSGSDSKSSSISSSMSKSPVRYLFRLWDPAAGIVASEIICIISSILCIG